ncbi:conserved Plasmodium protein, unknown function [Plasmodium relictum]|uniref:Uncharacterized protein n=1 Tax=Plasmodium relictum TaxID=85471 RepID=A0A1J1H1K2_PLARL|nr:conserved Plasmodium protein, unknown function [Plasmodium relictum]CRG98556.1 conserved Plasmodium protein, unknown function [Plasmodium relictum]
MSIIETKNKKVLNKKKQYVENLFDLYFYSSISPEYSKTRKRNVSSRDYNNEKINMNDHFRNRLEGIMQGKKKEKLNENNKTYELLKARTNNSSYDNEPKTNFNKISSEGNIKICKSFNKNNSIQEKYRKNEVIYSDNILCKVDIKYNKIKGKTHFNQNYKKSIFEDLNEYSKKLKIKSFNKKTNSKIFEKYNDKDFKLEENDNNTKNTSRKRILNSTGKILNIYHSDNSPLKEENVYVIKKDYILNENNMKQTSRIYLKERKGSLSYSNNIKIKSDNLNNKNKDNKYILSHFKFSPNKKKESLIYLYKKLRNDINYENDIYKNKKENFVTNKTKEIKNKKFLYLKKEPDVDQNRHLMTLKSNCDNMKVNEKKKEKVDNMKDLKYSVSTSKENTVSNRQKSNNKLIRNKYEQIIYFSDYNKDTLKCKIREDLKKYISKFSSKGQFNKSIPNVIGVRTFSGINKKLCKTNEKKKEYVNGKECEKIEIKKLDLKKKNESILRYNTNESLKYTLFSENEKVGIDTDITNKISDKMNKNKEKVNEFLEKSLRNGIYERKKQEHDELLKNNNIYENIHEIKTFYKSSDKILQIKCFNKLSSHNKINCETKKSDINMLKVKSEISNSEKGRSHSYIENLGKEQLKNISKLEIEKNKKESKPCELKKENLEKNFKLEKNKSKMIKSNLLEKSISLENFEKKKSKTDMSKKLKIEKLETDISENNIPKNKFEKNKMEIEKLEVDRSKVYESDKMLEKNLFKMEKLVLLKLQKNKSKCKSKKKKTKKSKKDESEKNKSDKNFGRNKSNIEKMKSNSERKCFEKNKKIIELERRISKLWNSEIRKYEMEASETDESREHKSEYNILEEKLKKKKLIIEKLEKLKKSLSELEKLKIRLFEEETSRTEKSKEKKLAKNKSIIDKLEMKRYKRETSEINGSGKDESGDDKSKEKLEIKRYETETYEVEKSEASKSGNNQPERELERGKSMIEKLENNILILEKSKRNKLLKKSNGKKLEKNRLKINEYLAETSEKEKVRKNKSDEEKVENNKLKLEKFKKNKLKLETLKKSKIKLGKVEEGESEFGKLKMEKYQIEASKMNKLSERKFKKKLENIKLKLEKLKIHGHETEMIKKQNSKRNNSEKSKSKEKLEIKKYISETFESEKSITKTSTTKELEIYELNKNELKIEKKKLKLKKLKNCKIRLESSKIKKHMGELFEINESEKKILTDEKTKKNKSLMDKLEKNRSKIKKLEYNRIKEKNLEKTKPKFSKLKVKKYIIDVYETDKSENILSEKKTEEKKLIINKIKPKKLEMKKFGSYVYETDITEETVKTKKKKIEKRKTKKLEKLRFETEKSDIYKSKKKKPEVDKPKIKKSELCKSIITSEENLERDISEKKLSIQYKSMKNELQLEKLSNDKVKEEKSEDSLLEEKMYIEKYEREMSDEENSYTNKLRFEKFKIKKNRKNKLKKKKSQNNISKKNKVYMNKISETQKLEEKLKRKNIKKERKKSEGNSIEEIKENENSTKKNIKDEQIYILEDNFNNISTYEHNSSNLNHIEKLSEKSSRGNKNSNNLKTIHHDEKNINDIIKFNKFHIEDCNDNKKEIKERIIKIFKSSMEDFYFNNNKYSPETITLNNLYKEKENNFHKNQINNENNDNFYGMYAFKKNVYKYLNKYMKNDVFEEDMSNEDIGIKKIFRKNNDNKKKTSKSSKNRSSISFSNGNYKNIKKNNIEMDQLDEGDTNEKICIDVSRYRNEYDYKDEDNYKNENLKSSILSKINNGNNENYSGYYNGINDYDSNKEYYYNKNEEIYEKKYKEDNFTDIKHFKKQDISYSDKIYLDKCENLTKSDEKIHLDALYKSKTNEFKFPKNLSLFIKKKIDIELKKNIYKKIYKIIDEKNYDNKEEIKKVLNLFSKYSKLNKSINNFVTIDDTKKVKKTIQKREKKRNKKKEKKKNGQKEDSNIDINNVKKRKLKIINIDNATNNLPLTMLIIRNFEEKKNFDKNINIRYKVELAGIKKVFKIKKVIEKEKELFSRVEGIYNFSNLNRNESNENYNNLINKYIPFPNIKSCSPEFQHKFTIFKSMRRKKTNFFNMNKILKTNGKKKYSVKFENKEETTKIGNDSYHYGKKSKLTKYTYASFKEKESKNFLIKRVVKKKENEALNKNEILKSGNKKSLFLKSFSSHNENKITKYSILSSKKKYAFKTFILNNIDTSFNRNKYIINFNKYTARIKECIATDKKKDPGKMNQLDSKSLSYVNDFLKVKDDTKNENFILKSYKSDKEKINIYESKDLNLYKTNIQKYNNLKIVLKDFKKMSIKQKKENDNIIHNKSNIQGLFLNENVNKNEHDNFNNKNYNEDIKIKENKIIYHDKSIFEHNNNCMNNYEHNNGYKSYEKESICKYDKNENTYKIIDKKLNYVKNGDESNYKNFDKKGSYKKYKDGNSHIKSDKNSGYDKYEDIYKNINENSSYDKYENIYMSIASKSNNENENTNSIIYNKNSHKIDGHNFDNAASTEKEVDRYISRKHIIDNEKDKYNNKIKTHVKVLYEKENKKKVGDELLNEKRKIDKNINLQFSDNKVSVKKKNGCENDYVYEKFLSSETKGYLGSSKESIKNIKTENKYNINDIEKYSDKLYKKNAVSKVKKFRNIVKKEKRKDKDFVKNRNKIIKLNFDSKIKSNDLMKEEKKKRDMNEHSLKLNVRRYKENAASNFSKIIKENDLTKLNKTNNFSKIVNKNNSPNIIKKSNFLKLNKTNIPMQILNKNEKIKTVENIARNVSIYVKKGDTLKKNTSKKVKKVVKLIPSKKVSHNLNYSVSFETEIKIDENFLKNNKKEGKNSNYIDLNRIKFSKSSLEFFIEKNLLEKSYSEIKFDNTKKEDFQKISNTDNPFLIEKKKKGKKKKLFKKIINSRKTSKKDQSSNLNYDESKKQQYFSSNVFVEKKSSATHQQKKRNNLKCSVINDKKRLSIFDLSDNISHLGASFIHEKKKINKSSYDKKFNSFTESLRKIFRVKRKVKLSKNITINFSNYLENLEIMESKKEESEISSKKQEQILLKEKSNKSENVLVVKINIITIFLPDLYIKKVNMKSNYYLTVTIYFSNDIKTIKNNCVVETFQTYFTSYTNGIALSSDAFKKIICGSESKNIFKIVISCCREKAILKKELIKIYSRTFKTPLDLRTYNLSREKKYSYETSSANDELYEKDGTIILGTL